MLSTLKEFCKLSETHKGLIVVNIHTAPSTNVDEHKNLLELNGIKCNIFTNGDHSYMPKIRNACSNGLEYSMKIDEDIFINHFALEYIIDNLHVLDDKEVLMITPALSNGIPTTEMFAEDFLTEEEKNNLFNIFKSTNIQNLWGADYSSLNLDMKEWSADTFYNAVQRLNHHYKGIHPVRVNPSAQKFLLDVIRDKKSKLLEKQDYNMEFKKIPYLCNSVFAIRTDVWSSILSDSSFFFDGFDEVMLNQYKDRHNLDTCIVRKANCIHPAYNTISQYMEYSEEFNKLLNSII